MGVEIFWDNLRIYDVVRVFQLAPRCPGPTTARPSSVAALLPLPKVSDTERNTLRILAGNSPLLLLLCFGVVLPRPPRVGCGWGRAGRGRGLPPPPAGPPHLSPCHPHPLALSPSSSLALSPLLSLSPAKISFCFLGVIARLTSIRQSLRAGVPPPPPRSPAF